MKLLEFPHSHYCEKARWALDVKGIPFERVALLPGFHMRTVRRHAPKTSVPVLLNESEVVQGSSEIIDYLDEHFPEPRLTPQTPEIREECSQFEAELGSKFGEPIRTILYDRLLAYPDYIRFCFTHPLPVIEALLVHVRKNHWLQRIRRTDVVVDDDDAGKHQKSTIILWEATLA